MNNKNKFKLWTSMYYSNQILHKTFSKYSQFIDFANGKHSIGPNQKGGDKIYSINYKNHDYKFDYIENDNMIVLASWDNPNNECVGIHIDKTSSIANINSINADMPSCVHSVTRVGTILLKITMGMLKKYKNKLGIKVITLSDKSYLNCNGKTIELSYLSVLATGQTWCNSLLTKSHNSEGMYGKYGFRPFKYENNSQVVSHEYLLQVYNTNIKIMDEITISQVNWNQYIENQKVLKAIEEIILVKPSMLVKKFIKNILLDWNKNCDLISKTYIKLFNDIGLIHTGTLYGKFI
jgi:hypothetical protein